MYIYDDSGIYFAGKNYEFTSFLKSIKSKDMLLSEYLYSKRFDYFNIDAAYRAAQPQVIKNSLSS